MRRLIRNGCMIIFFLGLPGVAAQAQEAPLRLSLAQAVKMALERNPEILIAQAQSAELEGRIKEVRAGAYPQINAEGVGMRMRDPSMLNSASFDRVPQEFKDALVPVAANLFDLALTIKQPIYTAGKVGTAIRLAEQTQEEKLAALEAARKRVTFKVFQAFQDILLAEENLAVTRETYQRWQKHLEQARVRYRQGAATEIDVLRSEVNATNVEPDIIRAENRLRQARSNLNSLMMERLDAPLQIAGKLEYKPIPAPDLPELERHGLSALPEIQMAQRQLQEARLMLALAHAESRMGVDMDGRWGYSVREPKNFFHSDFSRWSVTFNFRLPFYDGGRKAGLVMQATARVRAAEQSLALLENGTRLEIKSACDDLQASAKAIAAAKLNVNQAEKVLTMMQANYQYGAATTLDIVDSQTALTMANNAEIGATYFYELAKARMRLAAGMPILDAEEVKQ